MAEQQKKRGLFVKSGNAMRIFLINSSIVMMIGIWLSGIENMHWIIDLIPGLFSVSAIMGICPGINLWRMVLKE